MATNVPSVDQQLKNKIFNDSLRHGLSSDKVPALLSCLDFTDVKASDVKTSEGGLVNTVFVVGKYIVKVNTFNRFPFSVR